MPWLDLVQAALRDLGPREEAGFLVEILVTLVAAYLLARAARTDNAARPR